LKQVTLCRQKKYHVVLALAGHSVHNGRWTEISRRLCTKMPALNFTVDLEPLDAGNQQKQRHRMMLALVLLLTALLIVIVKSRDVWFQAFSKGTPQELHATSVTTAKPQENTNHFVHRIKRPEHLKVSPQVTTLPVEIRSEIQERVAVPYAEVISGLGQSQMIYSHNSSIRLPLRHGSKLSNAVQRITLSSGNMEAVSHRLQPEYSLFAKPMNVQGPVVLLARIDSVGKIERVQVLSGPESLARAAEEVLKQWRFKPHYQAGVAVETEARITVNFAIVTE